MTTPNAILFEVVVRFATSKRPPIEEASRTYYVAAVDGASHAHAEARVMALVALTVLQVEPGWYVTRLETRAFDEGVVCLDDGV